MSWKSDWISEKSDALRIASEDACSAFNELRVQLVEAESRIAYLQDQIKRRDDELASLFARIHLYHEEEREIHKN
jgi:uncharacterized small protein (DUF1192 family)